jgi:hypothetical protein
MNSCYLCYLCYLCTKPLSTTNDSLTLDNNDVTCHPALLVFSVFQRSESIDTAGGEFRFDGHRISSIVENRRENKNLRFFLFYSFLHSAGDSDDRMFGRVSMSRYNQKISI